MSYMKINSLGKFNSDETYYKRTLLTEKLSKESNFYKNFNIKYGAMELLKDYWIATSL